MTERVLVAIDGANFARQVDFFRDDFGGNIGFDFEVLKMLLARLGSLQDIIYYTARKDEDVGVEAFLNKLHRLGFVVRHFPLRHYSDGTDKGDIDHELIVDIYDREREYDILVLVSADGDYTPLVKSLQRRGKRVIVISHTKAIARSLRESGAQILPVEKMVKLAPNLIMEHLPAKLREAA
ncbi:MAG: NYN domain-containing protein [Candidatus Cloacimonetes bacterium]|nr:NYN domain-containing protein [Candidatus Cloacimonadota bacterium]